MSALARASVRALTDRHPQRRPPPPARFTSTLAGPDECQTTRGCCWAADPGNGPQCFFPLNSRIGGPLNISFAVAPAADDACFRVRDVFGFDRGHACASAGILTVTATDGPSYFL
jgi:hypothetical protein